MALVSLVTSCGAGSNRTEVCKDAAKVISDFNAKIGRAAPFDVTQWQRATADFAARLDALSKKAANDDLKTVLHQMAMVWRGAGTALAADDISLFQSVIQKEPTRLAAACRG